MPMVTMIRNRLKSVTNARGGAGLTHELKQENGDSTSARARTSNKTGQPVVLA